MSEFKFDNNNDNDIDFLMSGGACTKPANTEDYAGLEQLIDDPILANGLSSFKSLLDGLKVGDCEPPEKLLGKYILETATCTSIKSVMKQELMNKVNKHYNDKREYFEQHLKIKIQTYVNEHIPEQLKKGLP